MFVCIISPLFSFGSQFSTDEDTVVPSGSCQGYSWRSHMTSPRQLQLCLVDCDSWQWTDPFSIDSLGVVKVEVTVRGLAADVYVKVTQLGGLQKQVSNACFNSGSVCFMQV